MFSFEDKIIAATIEKLLNGEDYRQEVVNDINVKFLDFTLEFFRKIVDAKINDIATQNYEYLKNLIRQLEIDGADDLNIQIKITKNGVSVDLNLSESLLVLNALATKKNFA